MNICGDYFSLYDLGCMALVLGIGGAALVGVSVFIAAIIYGLGAF